MSETLKVLSALVGWIYFAAWSISFYGQFYTNYKLKNVEGYKLDFQVLNFTGFAFYSYMYIIGYFNADTNPFNNYGLGKVEIQDLLFAVHAFIMVCCCGIQCLIYPRGKNKVSIIGWILVVFYWLCAPIFYLVFSRGWIEESEDFNFVLLLGSLKLSISVIKYIPPAYWNYVRKSTVGWSIENILLDFTGGFFSIAQTVMNVWSAESSKINPIKFTLGNVSMAFDILFIVQHYILYKKPKSTQQGTTPDQGYVAFNDSHFSNEKNRISKV